MANIMESRSFDKLEARDPDHLVEEIRDLSKRERDRLLGSIRLILHHLLKCDYQPQNRSRSWQLTIERERTNIALYLEDSPTLITYLSQEWIDRMYRTARLDASQKTQLAMPKTFKGAV